MSDDRVIAADELRIAAGSIALIPGLSDLWSETTGDPRVVVAILDGPVDRAHPALAGARLETVEAAVPAEARHGGPATCHGTAVASLIFGRHAPDNPVRGMAPGCRGLVVPIFSEADGSGEVRADEPFRPVCSQLDLARAILLAVEHGARIINISAGQPLPASAAYPIMAAAVDRAVRRGILVVAAAGNDGCECEHIPAALPGVLAVGAMDSRGRPIASSNWASSYRSAGLLAPGTGLLAARAGGGTSVVGGTSFATAIVAGAAALLASLALRRGQSLDGTRIRQILLDTPHKCMDHTISCRQWLAGRLDLLGSRQLLSTRDLCMSDDIPLHAPSAGLNWPTVDVVVGTPSESTLPPVPTPGSLPPTPSATAHVPAPARHLSPSEGCDCASCRAKAEPGKPRLVFALGQIGYDLISEARRDSIQQHMGGTGANPLDPSQILGYLKDNPWEAGSIVWTLNIDQTPVYAIMPAGPFAAKVYDLLREFLDDQINRRVEMVSIPGRLASPVRLLNSQVVPAVIPEPRGMYSWTTGALVEAVVANSTPQDGKAEAVREFLQKVYYELRNLGLTAEERAVNYSATNAFQVEKVFESAIKESLALDTIAVERSPLCRPDSDCWDVKIHFFYPERQVQTVRKVFRFTVDVSDVVPVIVGPARSWFVR
jgi:cyanobactin maturation PatA/PatG family protease